MGKKIMYFLAVFFISLVLCGCTEDNYGNDNDSDTQAYVSPSPEEIEKKEFCKTDDDCICAGIDRLTGQCFLGNINYYKKYVDGSRQCPDFCSGIAGNMVVRCVDSSCIQVYRCLTDNDCDAGELCSSNKCIKSSAHISECRTSADCRRDGCSGQLCVSKSSEPVFSTCEYLQEYDCLELVECSCIDGRCAWSSSTEYQNCLNDL